MINKFKLLSLTIIMASAMGLAACETMEGAGRDIENAGEAVQDAAE